MLTYIVIALCLLFAFACGFLACATYVYLRDNKLSAGQRSRLRAIRTNARLDYARHRATVARERMRHSELRHLI